MKDPYGRSARFYNPFVEPWLRSVKKKIVAECLRLNLGPVLDVGCGTGTLIGMLRREGIRALGVEPSQGMIRVSRDTSPDTTGWIRSGGECLPFHSRSFRGVILSMVLHENPAPRRREILRESLRVLDSGGNLFILDYSKPSAPFGKAARSMAYLVERVVGGEHFRNYRQFMQEGALPAFLNHLPPDRLHWEPVFHGSMSLAKISKETGA